MNKSKKIMTWIYLATGVLNLWWFVDSVTSTKREL